MTTTINIHKERRSGARSITKRKWMGAEIAHLASFPELNPNPIIEVDLAGKITYRNAAAIETLKALGLEDNPNVFLPRDINEILDDLKQKKNESYREVQVGDAIFGESFHFTPAFETVRIYATDITEQKRMQQNLEESEKRFKDVATSSGDWIWEVDKDGKYTFASGKVKRILGYTPEELIGKTPFELMPEDEAERAAEVFRQIVSEKKTIIDLENWNLTKNGERICLLTNGVPMLDEKGDLLGYRGVDKDITERKLAEQKLRLQSEIAENMFEGVILIRESDGVITYTNSRFAKMFGYGSGELIGKNIATINAPTSGKSPEGIMWEIETVLKKTGVWNGEVLNVKKDGTPVWCRANVSTIKSSQYGDVWVSTREDITERKRMEETRSHLAAIVESSDDAIISKTLDGTVTSWNKAAEKMYGYSAHEAVGKSISILIPPNQLNELKQILERVQRGEKIEHYETKRVRKDGKIIDTAITVSPIKDSTERIVEASTITRDITESKKMEETLRESEERYRTLFDSTNDAIFIYAMGGKILEVNKVGCERLRYSREELLQLTPKDISTPEYAATGSQRIEELRKLGHGLTEMDLVTRDGIIIPTELSRRIIQYKGEPAVLSIARDITERKQMEEGLRKSEEMYRRLFESSQEGIIILDADTEKIIDVNPSLKKLSGYSLEQIRGKKLWEIESFKHVEKDQIDFKKLQEEEYIRVAPLPIATKEKESISAEFVSSIFEHNGRRLIQCNIRDITEQLRLQEQLKKHNEHLEELVKERTQALRQNEEQYRLLVNNTQTGFVVINDKGIVIDANESYLRLVDAGTMKGVIGHSVVEWTAPDEKDHNADAVALCARQGYIQDFETIYQHGDGTRVNILINATMQETSDGKRLIALCRDVTERKYMEKMRGQFISTVTHELRTPLVSIQGYLDLILSGGEIPSQTKEDLEVVKRNTHVLIQLVNDLLDVQRLASGKLPLDLQPLKLRKLIQDCIQQVQPLITEKNHNLKLETPDSEVTIVGDKTRLSQVLMNMLQNAIKFTPDHGRIIVRVTDDENSIQVQVVDSGIGIRKEDLEKVFEPFSAIQKSNYVKGTGLGMSVARGLIRTHGGRIWAESEGEGKGATFTFTLPKRKELG